MSTPTNPYGYPPYPEQPGEPSQAGQPQYPQPQYPMYPSSPEQPYGAPPPGYYPPQGYPAYPQGGMPPFAPPVAPPRKRNTTLWVVLSIVGVLAVLACVACGIFAFGIGNLVQKVGAPAIVTGEFCAELQQANYSAAYDRFSDNLQSRITREDFVSTNQQRDSSLGPITHCTVTNGDSQDVHLGSTSASFPLTITRGSISYTGTISLTKDGTHWKIYDLDPSLHLLG